MSNPERPEDTREPSPQMSRRTRLAVPTVGFVLLAILSFTLIVVTVLRPWSGPDTSWRTHMNLTEEPLEDFTRTIQAFVSPEGSAPILVWQLAECDGDDESCAEDPAAEWVARGCANCHGLDGAGGRVGPNVLLATVDDIRDNTRFGPGGMPAFDPVDLSDEHIALIGEYVEAVRIANPGLVPTPTPVPPTPTPTAVATVEPGSTPPTNLPSNEIIVLGKLLYEETAGIEGCAACHGIDGRGQGTVSGQTAPNIRGMTRSQVRQALGDVLDMSDIELSSEELMAIVAYLQYLNTQS